MQAFVTVSGKDKVGIIAEVATLLARENINIDDLSQTVLQGEFNMIMAVTLLPAAKPIEEISALLKEKGKAISLDIAIRNADIFNAMHRI